MLVFRWRQGMGLVLQVISSQWFGACALSVEKVHVPGESVMIPHYLRTHWIVERMFVWGLGMVLQVISS